MDKKLILEIVMAAVIVLDIYAKIPQITKLVKYKQSTGISVKYYVLYNMSCALYVMYCALIHEIPLLVETILNLVLNIIITILAYYYKEK